MTKRNRQRVVDSRWEKKEQIGRVVKDEEHSYIKPPITAKNPFQVELLKTLFPSATHHGL